MRGHNNDSIELFRLLHPGLSFIAGKKAIWLRHFGR
jgi:hypothetical protein